MRKSPASPMAMPRNPRERAIMASCWAAGTRMKKSIKKSPKEQESTSSMSMVQAWPWILPQTLSSHQDLWLTRVIAQFLPYISIRNQAGSWLSAEVSPCSLTITSSKNKTQNWWTFSLNISSRRRSISSSPKTMKRMSMSTCLTLPKLQIIWRVASM